jgi:hypothetical protein
MTTLDTTSDAARIEYPIAQIRDLRVVTQREKEDSREQPVAIEVRGEPLRPSQRFWQSLFHRFGLAGNVFRYFRYDEVFARVAEANPDSPLRLCVERRGSGDGKLLAVSSPRRPLIDYDGAMHLVRQHGGASVDYRGGVVTSDHTPRSGERSFLIGPDQFNNRYNVEVPVDGYGQPRIYLSLLREVCSNGAVGYARAFRSDIRIGNDAAYTLDRALGQFDHEEGFAALRQRFESAQKSWASIYEVLLLRRTLCRIGWGRVAGTVGADGNDNTGRDLSRVAGFLSELDRLAGDLHALYGMANLDGLSPKRQRVLPAKCRVYDLLNFASEIATHRATQDGRMRLQAYIGTLVSDEYDLEGTAEKVPEFKDLFLNLN